MLENFIEEMETIKLINTSYVKNSVGGQDKLETITEIIALVTNGKVRATSTTGSVEFIDYLKVHYDVGELKKGDKVEIRGSRYVVSNEPRLYDSHFRCEVVRIVWFW